MAKKQRDSRKKDGNGRFDSLPKPKLNLAPETKRGIAIIIFVILAGITGLSLLGLAGTLGTALASLFGKLFGFMEYLTPVVFVSIAWALFRMDQDEETGEYEYARTYLGALLLVASIAGFVHMLLLSDTTDAFGLAGQGRGGGYLGALLAGPLHALLGLWGGLLVLLGLIVIGVLVTFNIAPAHLLKLVRREKTDKVTINSMSDEEDEEDTDGEFVEEEVVGKNDRAEEAAERMQRPTPIKVQAPVSDSIKLEAIQLKDRRDWKLPPFDLLDDNKTEVDSGNIENNVTLIHQTLRDFGIDVEMGEVNVGPTVTQYTLRPAMGVKLSQIAALQNDLALALSAHSIRMELPIPGKALVGIEIPNKSTAIVRLREVMQTTDFVNFKGKLALGLGRDVAGRPMIADLAKMPHLLIAGATGTGKSVAINSLFISLLYRNTPQDVKFIVVDPKRVELNLYNGIPHLLTPVITESDKAINALKWAVAEMDRRYKLLSEAGKRNISEYNEDNELKLPYIVVLVDELADLMAVAQQEVEAAIVRLAQMARAVGIHLVLATQRPSVEIITGLIKANITTRVAFAVASQIDSRTILDSSGAEKLLGNGDMLFVSAEFTKPRRVQGAYIGEKEVKRVVEFFKGQTGAVIYDEEITEKPKRNSGVPGLGGEDVDDDLYEDAKAEVIRAGKASASLLQRRLRVGYARAARLLDLLEDNGIIGPGEGAKPREVYGVVPDDEKAEYGIESDDDDVPDMRP
jgi:S-DNA-T family DNA segregation ATPase FtsK/SpoIIIE